MLADALDAATAKLLENNKSPSRKTHEPDNRASHYYLGTYWAEALANQDKDAALKAEFAPLAQALADNEDQIIKELVEIQGDPVDIGGLLPPESEKDRCGDAAERHAEQDSGRLSEREIRLLRRGVWPCLGTDTLFKTPIQRLGHRWCGKLQLREPRLC